MTTPETPDVGDAPAKSLLAEFDAILETVQTFTLQLDAAPHDDAPADAFAKGIAAYRLRLHKLDQLCEALGGAKAPDAEVTYQGIQSVMGALLAAGADERTVIFLTRHLLQMDRDRRERRAVVLRLSQLSHHALGDLASGVWRGITPTVESLCRFVEAAERRLEGGNL